MSGYFVTLPPVSAAYDKIQKYANFIHHFRFVSVFFGVSVSQNGLSEMLRQLTASLIISLSQKRRRLYDLGLALSCFNGAGFVFSPPVVYILNFAFAFLPKGRRIWSLRLRVPPFEQIFLVHRQSPKKRALLLTQALAASVSSPFLPRI